jgi:NhaP-type Na+/H+ or K+/H+ antiporter
VSESFLLLLALASVIVLGIAAQWLAWRLGVPSILLLLLAGFLAGPASARFFGRSLVDTDRLLGDALVPFVTIAVALILYEGGLSLRLSELREARAAVWRLVTLGAAITWVLTALAAWAVLKLSPGLSILLGAVLVVTGPTVIVPLLIHIRPSGRIGAILKWEGIVIDPIGAMLAVLVFEAILLPSLGEAAPHVAWNLVMTIVVGGAFGLAAGMGVALVIHWFWVPDYLENAVSIMFVVGASTAAHWIQPESGLLAAVVMGITLANQRLVDVGHIVEFKENLRVLIISSLFILLGATVRLQEFNAIGFSGLVFLGLVVFVVRPASAFLCTLGLRLSRREIAFLSVVGPRGIVAAAVASVFALRLQAEGYPEAGVLVPLTFLVIIGTVLSSSLLAPWVAHRMGLADLKPQGILLVGAHAWGRLVAEAVRDQGFRVLLVDTNRADLAAARMAGLQTHGESVLGEHLLDEIDLGGLGRLVAATPNDWVNVLAVHRFLRVFGRGEVYQLPPRGEKADEAHRHLHGRWLFDEALSHDELTRRVVRGAVVKTTPLTEEFTYKSFRARYGDTAAVLFVVTVAGRLSVVTADQPIDPKPGDTLISLVEGEAGK